MSKFTWITTLLSVVLVSNLGVLYYLNFQLRDEIGKLKLNPQTSEQVTVSPIQTVVHPTADPKAIEYYSATCNPACQGQIDLVKNAIVRIITPQVTKETVTQPLAVSDNTAREYSIILGQGSSDSKEWEDVPGVNAYINTNNYSNISAVIFEVALRIPTANDEVYARLYNATDKTAIYSSELTTNNKDSTILQANDISLSSGNKLYQLQMKTRFGRESLADSARIKIYTK